MAVAGTIPHVAAVVFTPAAISVPRPELPEPTTQLPALPARSWRMEGAMVAGVALVCSAHPALSMLLMGTWIIAAVWHSTLVCRAEREFIRQLGVLADRAEMALPAGHPCARVLRRYQGMLRRLLLEIPEGHSPLQQARRHALVERLVRRCRHLESLLPALAAQPVAELPARRADAFTLMPAPRPAQTAPMAARARARRLTSRRLRGCMRGC
ncbi:MAG: hypothetical protein AB2A00_04990 [Myxococcota bacterium]